MDLAVQYSPFLRSVADFIRLKHYSRATEKSYAAWVKLFMLYHGKCHLGGYGGEAGDGISVASCALAKCFSEHSKLGVQCVDVSL